MCSKWQKAGLIWKSQTIGEIFCLAGQPELNGKWALFHKRYEWRLSLRTLFAMCVVCVLSVPPGQLWKPHRRTVHQSWERWMAGCRCRCLAQNTFSALSWRGKRLQTRLVVLGLRMCIKCVSGRSTWLTIRMPWQQQRCLRPCQRRRSRRSAPQDPSCSRSATAAGPASDPCLQKFWPEEEEQKAGRKGKMNV